MTNNTLAAQVVDKMYDSDWFSQWLGIDPIDVKAGKCVLQMKVRREMLNGFGILHGGIAFSLADSAVAFASNSHGRMSVSIEASISYIEPCKEGDTLIATVEEVGSSHKIGIYSITILNQENKKVALFRGTVYRTSKEWFPEEKKENTNNKDNKKETT